MIGMEDRMDPLTGRVYPAGAFDFTLEKLTPWLEDCCEVNIAAMSRTADLYRSWCGWAAAHDVYAGSGLKQFSMTLKQRFDKRRYGQRRCFFGVGLR